MTTLEQYRSEARQEFAANTIGVAMAKDIAPEAGKADRAVPSGRTFGGVLKNVANPGMLLFAASTTFLGSIDAIVLNLPVLAALGLGAVTLTAVKVAIYLDNPNDTTGNADSEIAQTQRKLQDINTAIVAMTAARDSGQPANMQALKILKGNFPQLIRSGNFGALATLLKSTKRLAEAEQKAVWMAEFDLHNLSSSDAQGQTLLEAARTLITAEGDYEMAVKRHKAVGEFEDALRKISVFPY